MTRTSPTELTRELLRFNTVNPPGEERACAEHLGRLLQAAGFAVGYHEFADRRATLVATIGGTGGDRLPIAFTGHIDTVPLGKARWTRDPFAGETDADRLYGRGASDMKSGVAAMVVAALRLAAPLAHSPGVMLVITAGEETGHEGAKHLLTVPALPGPAGAIIVGEPTENYPYIGSKGSVKLELTARGVTAHASTPAAGVNAVVRAARAVAALDAFRFDLPTHPVMGDPTLNIGYLHGGININSVPDEAAIGVDIRTIIGQDHDALEDAIRRTVGETVDVKRLRENQPAWTEPAHPWVQRVYELVAPCVGGMPEPRISYYGTDGPWLARGLGGPPMIVLGPGEVSTMHATDEWTSLARIETAAAIYESIIRDWCRL